MTISVFFFRNPDKLYSGVVDGYADATTRGFSTGLPLESLAVFAQAQRLTVFRAAVIEGEDPTVVSDFNLRGSGAAITALKRCTTIVTNRIEAQRRREARFDYIARDPFARPEPAEASSSPSSPTMVGWSRVPSPVFPARALERGITTATVRLSCDAAADGSPENCSIISESPLGAGFGREAVAAMRSSQFTPTTVHASRRHVFDVEFSSR